MLAVTCNNVTFPRAGCYNLGVTELKPLFWLADRDHVRKWRVHLQEAQITQLFHWYQDGGKWRMIMAVFDDAELIIDLSQQWKLACMHEDSVEIWRAAFNYVLAASKCCLYSRGSSVFGNISSLAFSIESLSYHLHNENWLQLIFQHRLTGCCSCISWCYLHFTRIPSIVVAMRTLWLLKSLVACRDLKMAGAKFHLTP